MALIADDDTDAGESFSTDPGELGTRAGATDDGPITGPMPVVELAGGHLHVSVRRGVVIMTVDGAVDDDLADEVAPLLPDAADEAPAVVLDLDQATLLDREAISALCDALPGPDSGVDRCLVAGRLSSRLVLDRWEIGSRFVVFGSVADALQARTFVESGYGTGWTVSS